jgi:hypothetical protein
MPWVIGQLPELAQTVSTLLGQDFGCQQFSSSRFRVSPEFHDFCPASTFSG